MKWTKIPGFFILILIFIFISSCKNKECSGCLENFECQDGQCVCPDEGRILDNQCYLFAENDYVGTASNGDCSLCGLQELLFRIDPLQDNEFAVYMHNGTAKESHNLVQYFERAEGDSIHLQPWPFIFAGSQCTEGTSPYAIGADGVFSKDKSTLHIEFKYYLPGDTTLRGSCVMDFEKAL